jgi:hypothetical protein
MDTLKTYKPKKENIKKLIIYLNTQKPKENGK